MNKEKRRYRSQVKCSNVFLGYFHTNSIIFFLQNNTRLLYVQMMKKNKMAHATEATLKGVASGIKGEIRSPPSYIIDPRELDSLTPTLLS